MEITILVLIFVIVVMIVDKILSQKKANNNNENKDQIDLSDNNKDYTKLYERKEYILTQQELKLFKVLKYITDRNSLLLFTQVSLYAIVKNKNNNWGDFNKIKSKSIDFVITDTNTNIKICIELDGMTHTKEDRIQRDKFVNELFKQLDIQLLRIPVQNWYDSKQIEQKIKESL